MQAAYDAGGMGGYREWLQGEGARLSADPTNSPLNVVPGSLYKPWADALSGGRQPQRQTPGAAASADPRGGPGGDKPFPSVLSGRRFDTQAEADADDTETRRLWGSREGRATTMHEAEDRGRRLNLLYTRLREIAASKASDRTSVESQDRPADYQDRVFSAYQYHLDAGDDAKTGAMEPFFQKAGGKEAFEAWQQNPVAQSAYREKTQMLDRRQSGAASPGDSGVFLTGADGTVRNVTSALRKLRSGAPDVGSNEDVKFLRGELERQGSALAAAYEKAKTLSGRKSWYDLSGDTVAGGEADRLVSRGGEVSRGRLRAIEYYEGRGYRPGMGVDAPADIIAGLAAEELFPTTASRKITVDARNDTLGKNVRGDYGDNLIRLAPGANRKTLFHEGRHARWPYEAGASVWDADKYRARGGDAKAVEHAAYAAYMADPGEMRVRVSTAADRYRALGQPVPSNLVDKILAGSEPGAGAELAIAYRALDPEDRVKMRQFLQGITRRGTVGYTGSRKGAEDRLAAIDKASEENKRRFLAMFPEWTGGAS